MKHKLLITLFLLTLLLSGCSSNESKEKAPKDKDTDQTLEANLETKNADVIEDETIDTDETEDVDDAENEDKVTYPYYICSPEYINNPKFKAVEIPEGIEILREYKIADYLAFVVKNNTDKDYKFTLNSELVAEDYRKEIDMFNNDVILHKGEVKWIKTAKAYQPEGVPYIYEYSISVEETVDDNPYFIDQIELITRENENNISITAVNRSEFTFRSFQVLVICKKDNRVTNIDFVSLIVKTDELLEPDSSKGAPCYIDKTAYDEVEVYITSFMLD